MYIKADFGNRKVFSKIKLIMLDITFLQDNQYVVLYLKRSKTNIKHTEIKIIITATNNSICLVSSFRELFILNPEPNNALVLRLDSGAAFVYQLIIQIFSQKFETNIILYQR